MSTFRLFIVFFFLFFSFTSTIQAHTDYNSPPFLQQISREWVDSVFLSLTPEERIAQLFMVAAYSNKDQQHVEQITQLITKYNIGGLIFFQGGPVRQATLTNFYQSKSKTPLLIAIDGEWGLAMRLDSTIRFPRQMTLGAIQNDTLIYKMGAEIARQCKRMGIHINFAPVVDVNNNPLNPVINTRSFGENKVKVALKGIAYMLGMQANGILANAKHFPGHGDTDADSHKSLPVVKHSRTEMDTLELYPFKKLIEKGLGSIMVAHLYIPCYDTTTRTASTLSKPVVTGLLKNELAFNGLIFTDALNMKGVSAYFEPGIVDVKALLAGNDVLLFSEDVPKAISEIKKSVKRGEISQNEIDMRVKKILEAKYWAGLNNYSPVDLNDLNEYLSVPEAELLNCQLYESALTLLKNEKNLIPFQNLDTLQLASLTIGDSSENVFQQTLNYYAPVDLFQINSETPLVRLDSILKKLSGYDAVIISIHNTSTNPAKNFGITEQVIAVVNTLLQKTKVVLDVFGNPYCLSKIICSELSDVVLMSYEDTKTTQSLSAQLLFGGVGAKGKLPVTASGSFKYNDGINIEKTIRLKYTMPEEAGIHTKDMAKLDSIVLKAIQQGAMPGCQVLVAKDGKVIYNKPFGWHTYEKELPVLNTDIYDIASITKIASTALAVMDLHGNDKLPLDKKLYRFFPELKKTNKKDIVLREMFAHQAGLQGWMPFWLNTLSEGKLSKKYYRASPEDDFSVRIAQNLYIRNDYPDSMWKQIIDSPVNKNGKYVYSDLGLLITQRIVEQIEKQPLDTFVLKRFYAPLGLVTTGYNPRKRFPLNRIVPTENDIRFRRQLIHGDVHDPAAAMMGGVAGHAGIFSNANDMAVLMQMLLQGGEYAGKKYIKKEVISEFTQQQYVENENRRGIIFDKPEVDISKNGPTAKSASHKTFGHTGFTGTCVWVDPEYNLLYVFLSNRVHPDANNNKLVNMNVRTEIHQAIYDAIIKKQ